MIAAELEVVQHEDKYRLMFGGKVIKTLEGFDVEHASESLLQHMLSELDIDGSVTLKNQVITAPRFFGAYAIFSIQKAFVEKAEDELSLDFSHYLFFDQILSRVVGPEHLEQIARWSPVSDFLEENGLSLPNIERAMLGDPDGKKPDYIRRFQKEHASFITRMREHYQSLTLECRTVVTYLRNLHDGPVLFPLLLATNRCTPDQYASGVMAAHCLNRCFGLKVKEHRKAFIDLRDDARTAAEYLRQYGS